MSLTLSRADPSGSRERLKVVTRSTTDIAARSTTNSLIDQSSDPLLSFTAPVFTVANIGPISGCTFQILHCNVKIVQNERVELLSRAMRTIDFEAIFLSTLFSFELIFTASNLDVHLTLTGSSHIL